MDLSIIIVNYNTFDDIVQCVDSILKLNIKVNYEIIVIDNKSTDRRIDNINILFPYIKIIFSDNNNGFGYACNSGAKIAKGKYFAFINPDTVFNEDAFTNLFNLMEKEDYIGVSSGVLVNRIGNPIYTYNDFPGYKWEFTEAVGRGSHKSIIKSLKRSDIVNKKSEPFYVDWVIGAFMFFRADVFEKVKGFDDDFFLYYEDVEIQRKVHNLGFKIAVLPSVRIVHSERASVRSFEGENIYYFNMMRSKLIYFHKHKGIIFNVIVRIFHIVGIIFRITLLPFRTNFKNKKRQKIFQYGFMMKTLLLSYAKLLHMDYTDIRKPNFTNSENLIKDKFWN